MTVRRRNLAVPSDFRTAESLRRPTPGLQTEKESGEDVYLIGSGDWEMAGACLDAAARKAHA